MAEKRSIVDKLESLAISARDLGSNSVTSARDVSLDASKRAGKSVNDSVAYANDKIGSITENKKVRQVEGAANTIARGRLPGKTYIRNSAFARDVRSALSNLPDNRLDTVGGVMNAHLRKFLESSFSILDRWYEDPLTLCCIIKLLAAIQLKSQGKDVDMYSDKFEYAGGVKKLRNILIIMRAILDMLINMANIQVAKGLVISLDFITSMTNMMIGAAIGVMNGFLDKLAIDSYGLFHKLTGTYDNFFAKGKQTNFEKCWPFDDLLKNILNFMWSDGGLFAYFKRFSNDFMNKMNSWGKEFNGNMMINIGNLDKFRRLRNILNALIGALDRGEICLETDINALQPSPLTNIRSKGPSWKDGENKSDYFNRQLDDFTNRYNNRREQYLQDLADADPIENLRDIIDATNEEISQLGKLPPIASDGESRTLLTKMGMSDEQIDTATSDKEMNFGCGRNLSLSEVELLAELGKIAADFSNSSNNPFIQGEDR